jgi:two-component system, NarL family, nitrate/nitrite response regulator NarL
VANPRVLIVDDHTTFRSFARLVLTRAGYDVVGEAGDAQEARAQIAALQPDVVLLDVHLPGEDGIDIALGLPSRDVPQVVFVSSRDAREFGSRLRDTGRPLIPKERLSGRSLQAALAA